MKKIILLMAAMSIVLCLSSCKKEENGKVLFGGKATKKIEGEYYI